MENFEIVKIADIHSVIAPIVADLLTHEEGFEPAGPLRWVRSTDAPIRQMFCLHQWKGGVVAPSWGISLDFVPHVSGYRIKWHRTPKSAMLDLRVDSRDRSLDISYHSGPGPIRVLAPEVLPRAVALAREFWEMSRKSADLLPAFSWVRNYYDSRQGLGFYNFTQHPLALAFVYARNGHLDQAMAELNKFLNFFNHDAELEEELKGLLATNAA